MAARGDRISPSAHGGRCAKTIAPNGDAWALLPARACRSRAYRWNEDGLLGISDDGQRLCFALALWNGKDAILKERPFGLSGHEGNHGEDAKDYWFYLDNVPSHAYMRALYKYPQQAFPYDAAARRESPARARRSGVRAARHRHLRRATATSTSPSSTRRRSPTDMLIRITIANRGPDTAPIDLLPTLWFRNTWSWGVERLPAVAHRAASTPTARRRSSPSTRRSAAITSRARATPELLFTENETNAERLFGAPNATPYREGRVPRVRRERPRRRGEPGARRDQGRRRAIA